MFCSNCGKENEEGAKFCAYCGTALNGELPVPKDSEEILVTEVESQSQVTDEKPEPVEKSELPAVRPKKKKAWVFVVAAIIVLAVAAGAAGILAFRNIKEKQHYEDSVTSGNRYLEELDYEKAEAFYLDAISIDPKQKEPYQKLIDTYVAQGKTKKAVEMAEAAVEAVPEKEVEEFQEIIEEWKYVEEYAWVTEPSVEADDITYVPSSDNYNLAYNERQYQKRSDYAVIKQGDLYGLIGWDGKLAADVKYVDISACYLGFNEKYLMTAEAPVFDATMNSDWSLFFLDEAKGEVEPAEGLGGGVDLQGYYYYCEKLRNVNEAEGHYTQYFGYTFAEPEGAIPVRESKKEYTTSDSYYSEWLSGPYAIYSDGQLRTDFIYDECGSEVSGIMAVKKDGKWGYVDTNGKEVIPFEYDASWQSYPPNYSQNDARLYCFGAFEGYIPLVKDGVWEMRNANGDLVIPAGIFETIRPVHNGKCWVKQNGKWGVIEVGNSQTEVMDEAESKVTEEEDIYTEGEVEMNGVLENVEWEHPNGTPLTSRVIRLDSPVTLKVSIVGEMTEYKNCERIQLMDVEDDIVSRLEGERVKVTGKLAEGAHTAYYLDPYVIWNAVVVPEEDGDDTADGEKSNAKVTENQSSLTEEEIIAVSRSLNVPDNLEVEIKVGEPFYWQAGSAWLAHVSVVYDGKTIAAADINVDTKELATGILTYSP